MTLSLPLTRRRLLLGLPLAFLATAPGAKACRSRSNLPLTPTGRRFATLDGYLAYLKSQGPRDVPWYRPLRNGSYRLVTCNLCVKSIWTRAELKRKFGFGC